MESPAGGGRRDGGRARGGPALPDRGRREGQWLARADVDDIAWVLKTFGEERFAKKIARAIVHDRVTEPYVRTRQLAEMIARVNPSKEKGKHAATRSFQAIRIYINIGCI